MSGAFRDSARALWCMGLAAQLGCATELPVVDDTASATDPNVDTMQLADSADSVQGPAMPATPTSTNFLDTLSTEDQGWALQPAMTEGYGWVIMHGDTLGKPEASVSQERKPLKLTVKNAGGYTFGEAVALSDKPQYAFTSIYVPVVNKDVPLRCDLMANVTWKTAAGSVIQTHEAEPHLGFVDGSAGIVDDRVGAGCLAPGETGYLHDIEKDDDPESTWFIDLAEVELDFVEASPDAVRPGYRLVAEAYANRPAKAFVKLAVTFVNEGDAAYSERWLGARYMFLDPSGALLDTSLTGMDLDGPIAPGDSVTFEDTVVLDEPTTTVLAAPRF